MSRSIAIGAALLCALGGSAAAGGNPLDDVDVRVQFGSFGRDSAERALARAEQQLRAAEHAYADARRTLDGLLARQAALRAELSVIERKIAECRRTGNESELRRLEGRLADVHRDARAIESDISRLRNLAAEAGRTAEAARNEYFRPADVQPRHPQRPGTHRLRGAGSGVGAPPGPGRGSRILRMAAGSWLARGHRAAAV